MKDLKREFGVKKLSHFSRSPWWVGLTFVLPLLIMMHFASAATSDPGTLKFDHNKTGFILTGSHIVARCSSCHVDSVFKGTPRDCASCHVAGNRMGAQSKTTRHVATAAPCERCHQTTAWTPVNFNHVGVAPGSCLTCHNGTTANGKPSGHMSTNDSCDGCHKTIDWKQLTAGGTMPPNHLPTRMSCSLCHNQSSFIPGTMNHSGIVSGCANCHSGATYAVGMTPVSKPTGSQPHMPTNMPCEYCHSASNFMSFAGTQMKHTGIVSGCTSCHYDGATFAVGVTPKSKANAPTTHMATALDCSGCHTSTTTFSMANLTTPPLGHLPTIQVCSTCHSGFGPGSGVMTHTGISIGCTNCHNGQVFTGVTPKSKPVNHLPSNMTCETCHLTSSTNPGGFAGAPMKHTGIVGGCTNCHNGQAFAGITAVSKPGNHLPSSMSCETCHSTSNFTTFSGTIMKHTGIVSGCSICHGFMGAPKTFAVGVTPVAQTSNSTHLAAGFSPCESCHTSTVSFTVATGGTKPANHLPTTAACSLCHSAASFYPGVMNHTGIASGCTTCHNGQVFAGVTPVSKPVNHLPTSAVCETCHTTANTNPGGFAGGIMNHTGIVGGCANCHNGQAFAGVTPVKKSAIHIPYATMLLGGAGMGCEFCHSKTVFTSFTTGLVSSTIMHNGSQGGGSGTCVGCHLTGQTWSASMQKKSHNGASTAKDCSSSGCHRPRGGEGTAYLSW